MQPSGKKPVISDAYERAANVDGSKTLIDNVSTIMGTENRSLRDGLDNLAHAIPLGA
jgi:iron uptake system EfeUOB component EfeO/EfeM